MDAPNVKKEFPDALALENLKTFRNRLLKWFDKNKRQLPWRKNSTPYRVWISEIMLQQTQVATVIEYYKRFLKRFPNVKQLAEADVSEVLKLWEGLGYYRRARQLHAAAQKIVADHQGKFPVDFEAVIQLPGIGRYTASAILSISLNQPYAILEGNTNRLYARLIQLESDFKSSGNQKNLWKFAEAITTDNRVGDFNQALMELGNRVCKPSNPLCDACPVSDFCPTFIKGLQSEIPVKISNISYEEITEAIVLVHKSGKLLLRQCGEGERWTGLWDFPRYQVPGRGINRHLEQEIASRHGISVRVHSLNKTIRHAVTRFKISLKCYSAHVQGGRLKPSSDAVWMSKTKLPGLPMSVTGRKISEQIDELLD